MCIYCNLELGLHVKTSVDVKVAEIKINQTNCKLHWYLFRAQVSLRATSHQIIVTIFNLQLEQTDLTTKLLQLQNVVDIISEYIVETPGIFLVSFFSATFPCRFNFFNRIGPIVLMGNFNMDPYFGAQREQHAEAFRNMREALDLKECVLKNYNIRVSVTVRQCLSL